jgi:hypothetical protein
MNLLINGGDLFNTPNKLELHRLTLNSSTPANLMGMYAESHVARNLLRIIREVCCVSV